MTTREQGATAVLVADSGEFRGAILFRDHARQGAVHALAALRQAGYTDQRMFTGDRRRAANVIAQELGITQVEAGLLPAQKVEQIEKLQAQGRRPAMAGDGLNDAAALATANVGIAMAGASAVCNSGICGYSCNALGGVYALRIDAQGTWPSRPYIRSGSGTLQFWLRLTLSQSGTALTGTAQLCDQVTPPTLNVR